jgi:hypothetical protein
MLQQMGICCVIELGGHVGGDATCLSDFCIEYCAFLDNQYYIYL